MCRNGAAARAGAEPAAQQTFQRAEAAAEGNRIAEQSAGRVGRYGPPARADGGIVGHAADHDHEAGRAQSIAAEDDPIVPGEPGAAGATVGRIAAAAGRGPARAGRAERAQR